jgi:hypothetical protein
MISRRNSPAGPQIFVEIWVNMPERLDSGRRIATGRFCCKGNHSTESVAPLRRVNSRMAAQPGAQKSFLQAEPPELQRRENANLRIRGIGTKATTAEKRRLPVDQ